jgi:hypothetical protein
MLAEPNMFVKVNGGTHTGIFHYSILSNKVLTSQDEYENVFTQF